MSTQIDTFIQNILKDLETENYIRPEEIPTIELYMDQVTTFMDTHLASSKRNAEDKILTKTMINNYAKNNLLPPPTKKKYSRNHILMMIFIYYFKGFLSISDIQSILTPLAEEHFDESSALPLQELYAQIFSLEKQELEVLREDVSAKYELSKTTFQGEKNQDFLQCFSMISLLSFDVYMKKQIIEKMIDNLLPKPMTKEAKEAMELAAKKEKAAKKAAETKTKAKKEKE